MDVEPLRNWGPWLAAAIALTSGPLVLVVLAGAPMPEPISWDLAMLGGWLALGVMSLLPLMTARRVRRLDRAPSLVRGTYSFHVLASYLVLALVALHVVGLLWIDPWVVEYLLPSMPGYMWVGCIGTGALLYLIVHGRFSRTRFRRYVQWRWVHALLSLLVVLASGVHVVGAGYYLAHWAWQALLVVLLGLPTALSLLPPGKPSSQRSSTPPLHRAAALLLCAAGWGGGLLAVGASRWWAET